jgi:hypothetical protein
MKVVLWLLCLAPPGEPSEPSAPGSSDTETARPGDEALFKALAQALHAEFGGEELPRVSQALRRIADQLDALQAPAPVGGGDRNIFDYLLERYDHDGNGAIHEAEYDRGGDRFARLDRDADGSLTHADFDPLQGFGFMAPGAEMRRFMTVQLLALLFDTEAQDEGLTWEEMLHTFEQYDDGDDVLTREEFAALEADRGKHEGRASMMWGMLGDVFDKLAELSDETDVITRDALIEYFEDNDPEDRGVLEVEGPALAAMGMDAAWDDGMGPKKGSPAPDFALPTLAGDRTVQLSSFRQKRPVALIFGSYS